MTAAPRPETHAAAGRRLAADRRSPVGQHVDGRFRGWWRLAWVGALLGLGGLSLALAADSRPMRRGVALTEADPVGGAVIVQLRPGSGGLQQAQAANGGAALPQRVRGLAQRQGLTLSLGAALGAQGQVVRASGLRPSELLRRLAADPEVLSAEVDRPMRAHAVANAAPNDRLYAAGQRGANAVAAGQWYLRQPDGVTPAASDFEGAWSITQGSADIVVAVLDTGVRPEHPDLLGKLLPGHDFVGTVAVANDGDGRDADPTDPGDWVTQADIDTGRVASDCAVESSSWHGTLTAALVGAATQNGVGMAGAGRNVRVLPVRVLGKCGGFTSDIVAAMRWAAGLAVPGVPANAHPAKVINLSLGGPNACSATYQQAINEVLALGVVVVASAGNDGLAIGEPANCAGVIGVAGVRHEGTKNGFSDLGAAVAVSAPGGNCGATGACLYPILSAANTGSQGPLASSYTGSGADASFGTSFAAPLVSATAALLASVRPGATPTQIRDWIQRGTRPFPTPAGSTLPTCRAPSAVDQGECICTTSTCGAGILDARGAVTLAAAGTPVALLNVASTQIAATGSVTLDASDSRASDGGATLAGYRWEILEGATAASFPGSSPSASTAQAVLTATTDASVRVRLTVTDSGNASASATAVIRAGDAPADAVNGGGSSSGGGAVDPTWLLALAAAVGTLAWLRQREAEGARRRADPARPTADDGDSPA
jgi:serine protease